MVTRYSPRFTAALPFDVERPAPIAVDAISATARPAPSIPMNVLIHAS
jgi:hypothetical protein